MLCEACPGWSKKRCPGSFHLLDFDHSFDLIEPLFDPRFGKVFVGIEAEILASEGPHGASVKHRAPEAVFGQIAISGQGTHEPAGEAVSGSGWIHDVG